MPMKLNLPYAHLHSISPSAPPRPGSRPPASGLSFLRCLHIVTVLGLLAWLAVDDYQNPPPPYLSRPPAPAARLWPEFEDGTASVAASRGEVQTVFATSRVPCPAIVKVLQSSGPCAQVQFLDGPAAGQRGWVLSDLIK